ncbi:hypothetical protein RFI_31362 [Reticulomyxa filosa]|uniref:Sulfotransferase domain-containing protein n=1 Tax=Reticulomyxa filosa TaxID=46433 RepID=X6LVS2_RETFI|nr:hypothetical protein RFI_31362 [Reticulomyxa filosa]|eukprot:ETO06033.1 hypothetical protein RFI_31362 [Reticulomyxa filosa]
MSERAVPLQGFIELSTLTASDSGTKTEVKNRIQPREAPLSPLPLPSPRPSSAESILPLPKNYTFRIFALVSNRVGTTTLHSFFSKQKVPCLHFSSYGKTNTKLRGYFDMGTVLEDFYATNRSLMSPSGEFLRRVYKRPKNIPRSLGTTIHKVTRTVKAYDAIKYVWLTSPSKPNVLKFFQDVIFFSDISGVLKKSSCHMHCLRWLFFLNIPDPVMHVQLFKGINTTYFSQIIHNAATTFPVLTDFFSRQRPLFHKLSMNEIVVPHSNADSFCQLSTLQSSVYLYEVLDHTYGREMKYVLNIRPVKHWILSKSDHYFQKDLKIEIRFCKFTSMIFSNASLMSEDSKGSIAQHLVHLQWFWKWYDYLCGILHYFGEQRIGKDVVVFDIENDNPSKLVSFFRKFGLRLRASFYGHAHWSHSKKSSDDPHANILPMIHTATSEYDQIHRVCGIRLH